MTRFAQLLLALAALALWAGSRLPWVTVSSADGLGQPRTTTLSGSDWSTALIPLALLVLAAAVAVLAVRGWALRLLALLLAAASALMGYLGIGSWAVRDVSVRAAELAEVAVTALVGAQRHHWGAVLTLVAAVFTLVAAVLLLRSAVRAGATPTKYAAPATRREVAAQEGSVDGETGDGMSERMIWDALDEGRDPTTEHTEGR
jgi:uncharacterized membrane protein (TIGR02234 family)